MLFKNLIFTAFMAISSAQVEVVNEKTTIEALEGKLKFTYWTSIEGDKAPGVPTLNGEFTINGDKDMNSKHFTRFGIEIGNVGDADSRREQMMLIMDNAVGKFE